MPNTNITSPLVTNGYGLFMNCSNHIILTQKKFPETLEWRVKKLFKHAENGSNKSSVPKNEVLPKKTSTNMED